MEVQDTRELQRIKHLPTQAHMVLEQLSGVRIPQHIHLRPIQLEALQVLQSQGTLFAPLPVGVGKTLITYLAPQAVQSKRPVLLVPASLRKKTEEDFQAFGPHNITIRTYEWLAQAKNKDALQDLAPDLLMADESHKLKSRKTAAARRVHRYLKANPDTKFVALTGTIAKRSIRDYAHIMAWCLRELTPLPVRWNVLDEWARATDILKPYESPLDPGALNQLRRPAETFMTIREVIQRRIAETPGVVTAPAPLELPAIRFVHDTVPTIPMSIHAAMGRLRGEWVLPGGTLLESPVAVWRAMRQLSMGYYLRWTKVPPAKWMHVRQQWFRAVREALSTGRIDTPKQLTNAIERGEYRHLHYLRRQWEDIKYSFTPTTEAVVSIRPVPLLVWTDHVAFGEALEPNIPWCGSMNPPVRGPAVQCCSIMAHGTGKNLQWCSSQMLLSVPPTGATVEQLLGRTHRPGQTQEVTTYINTSHITQRMDWMKVLEDARYIQESTGQVQKVLQAGLTAGSLGL